jgi:hypothetical protein
MKYWKILENGDFNAFLSALKNMAETSEADSATHFGENVESPNLIRLNTFLHELGLRLG